MEKEHFIQINIYYSTIKRNEAMWFATTWMDLEITILSEVRERQISYDIANMQNLRKWYKWVHLQNRKKVTDIKDKFTITKGERWVRGIN